MHIKMFQCFFNSMIKTFTNNIYGHLFGSYQIRLKSDTISIYACDEQQMQLQYLLSGLSNIWHQDVKSLLKKPLWTSKCSTKYIYSIFVFQKK